MKRRYVRWGLLTLALAAGTLAMAVVFFRLGSVEAAVATGLAGMIFDR